MQDSYYLIAYESCNKYVGLMRSMSEAFEMFNTFTILLDEFLVVAWALALVEVTSSWVNKVLMVRIDIDHVVVASMEVLLGMTKAKPVLDSVALLLLHDFIVAWAVVGIEVAHSWVNQLHVERIDVDHVVIASMEVELMAQALPVLDSVALLLLELSMMAWAIVLIEVTHSWIYQLVAVGVDVNHVVLASVEMQVVVIVEFHDLTLRDLNYYKFTRFGNKLINLLLYSYSDLQQN